MNAMNEMNVVSSVAHKTVAADVVIVGASIAGTTAATLFARRGLEVIVVDRVEDMAAYKRMCTHFIQVTAVPVLEKLGVIPAMEAAGAMKNGLRIFTEAGWFKASIEGVHGYTLRRQKLDPILREAAARTPGVELKLGVVVTAVGEGFVEIMEKGEAVRIEARLVVGADGRRSAVAEMTGIAAEVRPHTRAGFLVYMKNVRMRSTNADGSADAQSWILGDDVCYAFPSDDGLTCLAYVTHESRLAELNKDREGALRARFASLVDGPDLSEAEVVGGFTGAANTPNTYRVPNAKKGIALVGDAALASDYIWGVGCGWALQSADMLVEHAAPALLSATSLDDALAAYARQHKEVLYTQHVQNTAFSATNVLPFLQRALFSAAPHDEPLRHLMALSVAGRISQRDLRIPLRLLWVTVRRFVAAGLRHLAPRSTTTAKGASALA